jgi:WD40 repeat protein
MGATGRLADYRIVKELGRGGQGIVYLAEDLRHARKLVALKVLRDVGVISPDSIERLRREVEAAARLNHPGICGIHEAVLDGPNPFIAMNYVDGETLAQVIARSQAPNDQTWIVKGGAHGEHVEPDPVAPTQRTPSGPSTRHDILRVVKLVEKAARALHVAHEARVIHRDIKPGNIMVTSAGDPVVLDFGLAQFEDAGLAVLTRTGEIWGTPAYLSPEQLQGMKVDRRTDVWSLGVTLYEALTLRRPFEGATSDQIFNAIQKKEPPDPCRLNRALPADLRVVMDTALEKDRERRYESALAFADDLRAVCEDRAVAARPIGPMTRFTRWARRNPGVAASLLTTIGVLLAGIVVAAVLLLKLDKSLSAKNLALGERDREALAKDRALEQSAGLRLLAESSAALANDPGLALLLALEGAELARDKPVLANGAALDALAELREVRTFRGNLSALESAEFSPDGRRVVTMSEDGEVRAWDVATGEVLASQLHPRVARASFTPRGACVVTVSYDGAARIWDAATWTELARLSGSEGAGDGEDGQSASRATPPDGAPEDLLRGRIPGVVAVNASPDASRVVMVRGSEGSVWDAETGHRVSTLAKPLAQVGSISFSQNGRRVLTVAAEGTELWDADSGQSLGIAPAAVGAVVLSRFSPDGRVIILWSRSQGHLWFPESGRITPLGDVGGAIDSIGFNDDGSRILGITKDTIRVWNAETGESIELCGPGSGPGGRNGLLSSPQPKAEFTRDGQRVVGASCNGTAHVWNAKTGDEDPGMAGQAGDVRFVLVSPDGSLVLTASSTGTATLWDSMKWIPVATLRGHAAEIRQAVFTRDGDYVVTASADRTARVWNARTYVGAPLLEGNQGPVDGIGFNADGRILVTAAGDGRPLVARVSDGATIAYLAERQKAHLDPQIDAGGKRVATLCKDGAASVFTIGSNEPPVRLQGSSGFRLLCFAPDGTKVAAASDEGTAYLFDAATGAVLKTFAGHVGDVDFVAFCAGGTRVATASSDLTLRLWDVADETEVANVPRHATQPPGLSPDGRRVAVISPEGQATVRDTTTGEVVARIPGTRHAAPRFSPDGSRLVTESADGTFRIWDAATGAEVAGFPRDEGDRFHEFHPGGLVVLTSARDGTATVWDARNGSLVFALRGRGAPVRDAAFSPDGRRIALSTSDDARIFDASTGAELWLVPVRHGNIRTVRFSPDGRWVATGYAGGLTRLWPADPLVKAREVAPRSLTLAEIQRHGVDDVDARSAVQALFEDYLTNEELAATLERRAGLSDRLRVAAIAAAGLRDPHLVAERLCRRSWSDVLRPNAPAETYAMALRRVQIALRLNRDVELGKTTLGAAQLRTGQAATALATLEQAASGRPHAPTSIFIALAHAKLGQRAEAVSALAGARRILDASGARHPEEIRRLLEEADAALAADLPQ